MLRIILSVMNVSLIVCVIVVSSPVAVREQKWNFGDEGPDTSQSNFAVKSGKWEVIEVDDNLVLAQMAESRLRIRNVILTEQAGYKNVDLRVRIKAVAGENEGGGGLIWRAIDQNNYYALSYNPFTSRHNQKKPFLRLYKLENGFCTQLDHVDMPGEDQFQNSGEAPVKTEWHQLRVTMSGQSMTAYFDDVKLLQAENETFQDVGKIGMWTRSDARAYFDDLSVAVFQERTTEQ